MLQKTFARVTSAIRLSGSSLSRQTQLGGRLGFAMAGVVDVGEVDPGRRKLRVESNGLAVRGLGLVAPALIKRDQPQAVRHLCELRIDGDCAPEVIDGTLRLPKQTQGLAQVGVRAALNRGGRPARGRTTRQPR